MELPTIHHIFSTIYLSCPRGIANYEISHFRITQYRPPSRQCIGKTGIYYAEELMNLDVQATSKKTGIGCETLLTWKDYVMLMKIKSVGPNYANFFNRKNVWLLIWSINDERLRGFN